MNVWKYAVPAAPGLHEVAMPRDHTILSLAPFDFGEPGQLVFWAAVRLSPHTGVPVDVATAWIAVIWPGQVVPERAGYVTRFLGTVVGPTGLVPMMVWHLWELTPRD